MPEGPECSIIAWRLGRHLAGSQVTTIDIHNGRYAKLLEAARSNIVEFNAAIADKPATVQQVGSKGKLVYARFDNGWAMLSTMGLSGSWVTNRVAHCGLSLRSTDAQGRERTTWFKDQLHYGTIKFVPTADLDKKLAALGPDAVLGEAGGCTPEWWLGLCKRKKEWTLPKLLMEQKHIAGVGNYLKAEALHEARASPLVKIQDFSDAELLIVLRAVLAVTARCYQWKAHRAGIPGHEAKVPRFVMKVYGKGLDPQRRKVAKVKTTDGRATFWVPEAQLLPGPRPAAPAPPSTAV